MKLSLRPDEEKYIARNPEIPREDALWFFVRHLLAHQRIICSKCDMVPLFHNDIKTSIIRPNPRSGNHVWESPGVGLWVVCESCGHTGAVTINPNPFYKKGATQ